ncbi:hypothetical protein CCH79_00000230 [Gambusia affinis]|uniref:Uncharacterized protein n=1 Tax=Gambusia affinis TaxID=33528 RepID=A0A315VXI8_GAMAF|nr:hypothetical protein CCH79_00000230 [Gambusia affinis]
MPRGKETSEDIRKKVVTAHRSGGSYKTVSKRFQLLPSTVRQIIYKWRALGITATLPRTSGINVHVSTIRRNINRHGIHGRVARRKPLLSRKNKAARLKFAREHLDKPEAFWTEESKTELFGLNHWHHI